MTPWPDPLSSWQTSWSPNDWTYDPSQEQYHESMTNQNCNVRAVSHAWDVFLLSICQSDQQSDKRNDWVILHWKHFQVSSTFATKSILKNLQRGFLPHRWYICRGRMSPWHSSFIQNKRGPIFRLSEYRELPLPIPGPGSLLPAPTCLYKKLNLGSGLVD